MATKFRSKLTVCTSQVNPKFTTADLFDVDHVESEESPIDQFLKRLRAINQLAPRPASFDPLQAQLVLLGVVAAVESYFRTLLRRLVTLDTVCQKGTEEQAVTYSAAIHLSKPMMPEAMLERVAFVSEKSLVNAIREFVCVEGNLPPELIATIQDYERVCHLRHCAVHRFGRLGVKNAIFFGLKEHRSSLEKPLLLNYAALQNAIAIATGVVKTTNNFVFNEVLSRLPESTWQWTFRKDKRKFSPYYDLFADTVSSTKASPIRATYDLFQDQHKKFADKIDY